MGCVQKIIARMDKGITVSTAYWWMLFHLTGPPCDRLSCTSGPNPSEAWYQERLYIDFSTVHAHLQVCTPRPLSNPLLQNTHHHSHRTPDGMAVFGLLTPSSSSRSFLFLFEEEEHHPVITESKKHPKHPTTGKQSIQWQYSLMLEYLSAIKKSCLHRLP